MSSSLSSPSSLLFPFHWPFSNGSPPRLTTWRLPPLNLQEYWLPLGPLVPLFFFFSLFFFSLYHWQLGLFPPMAVFPPSPLPPSLSLSTHIDIYPARLLSSFLITQLTPLTTSPSSNPPTSHSSPLLPWLTTYVFPSLISLPHSLFFPYSYPWMMSA